MPRRSLSRSGVRGRRIFVIVKKTRDESLQLRRLFLIADSCPPEQRTLNGSRQVGPLLHQGRAQAFENAPLMFGQVCMAPRGKTWWHLSTTFIIPARKVRGRI